MWTPKVQMVTTPHSSFPVIEPEELAALKERALAAVAEGITISDPRLPDNPIIYANDGFERLTGYRKEEVLGRNCRFLQGPDTDPAAVAELRRAVEQGVACSVDILNYRKDGTPLWNRLSINPVHSPEGELIHFIGVQSDITARKRAEEELVVVNRRLTAANERMSRSLEAAAEIQRSLLPERLPEVAGVDFAWVFDPCDELAGDSLNAFAIDDENLAFYVLDVSGHGVPAALLSVTLAQILSSSGGHSSPGGESAFGDNEFLGSPRLVAERLNQLFPMREDSRQYFTLFYGVLHRPTRLLRYVSAGHPAPLLLRPGAEPRHIEVGGFPIGLTRRPGYEERSLRLEVGDRLYVYTDGLLEATDPAGDEFGARRVAEVIGGSAELDLRASVSALESTAKRWAHSALHDDLSILALEFHGEEPTPGQRPRRRRRRRMWLS